MPKRSKKEEPIPVPCLNISVVKCWNCRNDMLVPYFSTDVMMPWGPESFSNKQIEYAKREGCHIEERLSKTSNETYQAAICPICGEMYGMFFYHNFSYVPGNLQLFLDDDDQIIKRVENAPLTITKPESFDPDKTELGRKKIKAEKQAQMNAEFENRRCIRVKFENNRNYKYNCSYPISVGDMVKVQGKMTGMIGTVVKIVGLWDKSPNVLEVMEVVSTLKN